MADMSSLIRIYTVCKCAYKTRHCYLCFRGLKLQANYPKTILRKKIYYKTKKKKVGGGGEGGFKCQNRDLHYMHQVQQCPGTLQPLYNTVCYNTVLDITRLEDGSQKCIDYIEK